jgi:hypothetical protein
MKRRNWTPEEALKYAVKGGETTLAKGKEHYRKLGLESARRRREEREKGKVKA